MTRTKHATHPVEHYDAITLQSEKIRALADLLQAVFNMDEPTAAEGHIAEGLDLSLAGPGFAIVAECLVEKINIITDHARLLLDAVPDPAEKRTGGAR